MRKGEIGVAHAGGIGPAEGLGVEAIPVRVADRSRPELRAGGGRRSGEEGPVLEERYPRALGGTPRPAIREDLEARVVHFEDEGPHQAARRLRRRRSSR